MNDTIGMEESERNKHFTHDDSNMMLLERLGARLLISHRRRQKHTKVRILPPSAYSIMIQTRGPSIMLP